MPQKSRDGTGRGRETANSHLASPENFRVSLSNIMIGANPIEPRDTSTGTCQGSSEDSDSTCANLPSGSEDASFPNDAALLDSSHLSGSNRSSQHQDSSEYDDSSVERSKNKGTKDKVSDSRSRTSSADESSSDAPLASSADSEQEDSFEGTNKPKTSVKKKQGKPTRSASPKNSDPSLSAETSSVEVDSSNKPDNAFTNCSTSGAESSSGADDSGWSISEDCRLRGMKEGNPAITWAEIGEALSRTKNEVKGRWKIIKDLPQNTTSDEDDTPQANKTSLAAQGNTAQKSDGDEEEAVQRNGKQGGGKGTRAPKASERTNHATAKEQHPTRWHSGKRNEKVAAENKTAKAKAKKHQEQPLASLSGEDASSESTAGSCAFVADPSEEADRQNRYMQDHVLPELYPPLLHPKPSSYFGERDCAVLAAVDSKYKRSKWLEMQANFYNVTGRMVPLRVIRAKCEQAEDDEERKMARRKDANGRKEVERWVSSLSQEVQEEP